jgi:hypothetical protein
MQDEGHLARGRDARAQAALDVIADLLAPPGEPKTPQQKVDRRGEVRRRATG